jgi:hypothetical protein
VKRPRALSSSLLPPLKTKALESIKSRCSIGSYRIAAYERGYCAQPMIVLLKHSNQSSITTIVDLHLRNVGNIWEKYVNISIQAIVSSLLASITKTSLSSWGNPMILRDASLEITSRRRLTTQSYMLSSRLKSISKQKESRLKEKSNYVNKLANMFNILEYAMVRSTCQWYPLSSWTLTMLPDPHRVA